MPDRTGTNEDTEQTSEPQPDGGRGGTTDVQQDEFQKQTTPVQYGESVSDIFNRPDTKPLLLQTIAIFTALGVGFGLFGYFAVDALITTEGGATTGGGGAFGSLGGTIAAFVIVFVASLTGPVVSVTTSIRTNGMLAYLKDDLSYATGAVGAAVGQLVLLVLTIFLVTNPIPNEMEISFGDFTNLIVLSVGVTGVVSAVTMYSLRSISDPVQPSE